MKNNTNIPLSHFDESFFFYGIVLESPLGGLPGKIEHIIRRWNYVKKEEVLGDLDQILEMSRPSGVGLEKNNSVYREMEYLIFTLREGRWGKWYFRVIEIISKYLQGIERFLTGSKIREFVFYKKLFEGTMIAIIEEVKSLRISLALRVFL